MMSKGSWTFDLNHHTLDWLFMTVMCMQCSNFTLLSFVNWTLTTDWIKTMPHSWNMPLRVRETVSSVIKKSFYFLFVCLQLCCPQRDTQLWDFVSGNGVPKETPLTDWLTDCPLPQRPTDQKHNIQSQRGWGTARDRADVVQPYSPPFNFSCGGV